MTPQRAAVNLEEMLIKHQREMEAHQMAMQAPLLQEEFNNHQGQIDRHKGGIGAIRPLVVGAHVRLANSAGEVVKAIRDQIIENPYRAPQLQRRYDKMLNHFQFHEEQAQYYRNYYPS